MAKKEKKKKSTSLDRYLYTSYGLLAALGLLILAVLLSIGISYLVNKSQGLLIALCITLPILVVLLVGLVFYIYRRTYKVFYNNLYENTRNNYRLLNEERKDLVEYSVPNVIEFEELNKQIATIKAHYANISLYSNNVSYEKIALDFINKGKRTVTEESFKAHIREVIITSPAYRSAIVSINYQIADTLEQADINKLIDESTLAFRQNNLLTAIRKDKKGVYVLVPSIDSISFLSEQLTTLFESATISIKTMSGISLVSPKINTVVYPYSEVENIFSDLEYSARQNKELNIYIPSRYSAKNNQSLFHTTANLNNISKILSKVSSLSYSTFDPKQQIAETMKYLKEISSYMSIEQTGIILYSPEDKTFIAQKTLSLKDNVKPIFNEGAQISEELIKRIEDCADKDFSFFFSNRNKIGKDLGMALDVYDVSSGFFYIIKNDTDHTVGIIYFVNTNDTPMVIDSYLRESLLVISTCLGFYLKIQNIRSNLVDLKNREQNILKMANLSTYKIDKNTYEIVAFSPTLKDMIPNIEVGQKCYKAFFGSSSPCSKCPMLTKNKTIMEINGSKSEVSYSINTKMSKFVELVINPIKSEVSHNRFDPNLLVNTYYSLYEKLSNLYIIKGKGYIELMSVDNVKELVTKYGNEGFEFYIRCFVNELSKRIPQIKDLYLFKEGVLAFIINDAGKLDMIDYVEQVYECAKLDYMHDDSNLRLNIAYETVKFPQEFSSAADLLRHLETCVADRDYKVFPTDTIHIEENDFYRPASRKEYILSIIDEASKNNKFIIKAQPVVAGENKSITSAELLIRLNDVYSQSLLNTDELIAVAGENNKLNEISDLLINFVGDLFKQFGFSIFKVYNFNRMSINVDYNFFRQENFINKIVMAINKYHFPKNFLTFEIGESNIAQNYDKFQEITRQLAKNDVKIVCDQYTGQYLSLDALFNINIKEIKTRRDFVNGIDTQSDRFESVKSLISSAKEKGINTVLVGVENGQQYKLISEFDPSVSLQGYYFHHPLDANELIEAIRKTNLN